VTVVDSYLNLNELKRTGKVTYSIRAFGGPSKGLVIGHETRVLLRDVTMHVGSAAQKRIRAGAPKEVHAVVRGTLVQGPKTGDWVRIRYNPRLFSTFVVADTEQPIHRAAWVVLDKDGAHAMLYPSDKGLLVRKNPSRRRAQNVDPRYEVTLWNG
jgi:hypothetical protein